MAHPFSSNNSKPVAIFTVVPPPYCTLLFALLLCTLGLYTLHHHSPATLKNPQTTFRFHEYFLSSSTNYTLSSYLRALTLHPHVAGTESALETVRYVETHFQSLGLDTHTVQFEALLSYPRQSSLSLHFSNGSLTELPLTEPGQNDVVRPYHAYSPSGSVLAKAVFVNYGKEEDYNALGAMGVNVTGCVVIARRSEVMSRGGVVRVAQKMGAVAVLLYAEGNRFRDGVERGTVMVGIGDPLSPGWAAEAAGGERLDAEENEVLKRFTKVPSLPISSYTAEAILRTMDGAMVPYEWRDTLKFKIGGVGSGPPLINFTYQGEKRIATIYNVFAVIRGSEEPDRYVLLGNHRDAWTFGAVDPNSGTATLLDIARRFALLLRLGWVPRRTIILCSWDAEEFGMIGSTEWVEQNLLNLGSKAVVYLNVDCAVQGPGFFPSATPQLDDLIVEVTKKVKDPDSEGSTLYEKWTTVYRDLHIQRLSEVDSDFAPFLQHAGIPSVDLHYGKDFPVYHTAFDSFSWMEKYGDPSFQRHVAVAGVWGLLALHLADDTILPFNYVSYASELQEYVSVLKDLLGDTVSLHPIITSIQELTSASKEIEEEVKKLREQEAAGDLLALKARMINDRLMLAERGFLESDGLDGRQWFKHLVYGPCGDCESKLSFLPGIANAISQSDRGNGRKKQAAIQHEIWRVARAIQRAAHALRGELT